MARGGDTVALGALYDVFAPRIFRFFRFRVSSADLAEDLMQKVFLKMVEQLPSYRPRGVPFGAWLFRVARNTWIDFGRTSHETLPLEHAAGQSAGKGDPEASASAAADAEMLRWALEALPASQREVIACRFFAELSPAETAVLLGCSEVSVRVLQHRALAGLRRQIEQREGVTSRHPERSPR